MEFNKEQLEVITSDSTRILCLAGAGTGKTACMIGRIQYIVDSGCDPESILVLTFTNAAAGEMKSRYSSKHTNLRSPNFKTFHAFCYELLCNDERIRKLLGYTEIPEICDDVKHKYMKERAKLICGTKLSSRKLDGHEILSKSDEFSYSIYQKCLRKLLLTNNLITFDLLCSSICDLFTTNSEVSIQYKNKYRYVFVDEFQDTDKLQWEFVSSFYESHIFVVGDALQSIYSFRGADNSIIKQLASSPEYKTYRLYRNYRSRENICEFANNISKYADDSYRIEIHSFMEGGDVSRICIDSIYDMGQFLKDFVESSQGSTAILARTNREVEYLKSLFNYDEDSELSQSQLIMKICACSSLEDELYYRSYELNSLDYSRFLRDTWYIDSIEAKLHFLDENYGKDTYIESLKSFIKLDIPDYIKYTEILTVAGISPYGFVRHSSLTLIDDIVSYIRSCSQRYDKLHIGTIHSSKGLEYDNVLIFGVGGKSFTLTSEENNNLYYVGVTRAKKSLMIIQ